MSSAKTLFHLPPFDVLFPVIFGHLELSDVWRLRTVCKGLHILCWDYFIDVCTSLSVLTLPSPTDETHTGSPLPPDCLGVGPGINILKKCTRLGSLRISSHPGTRTEESRRYFCALMAALAVNSACTLKRLCLRYVDIRETTPILLHLRQRCSELEELDLCGVSGPVISILPQLVTGDSLQRLTLTDLNQPLTHTPLPVMSLVNLKYISVSKPQGYHINPVSKDTTLHALLGSSTVEPTLVDALGPKECVLIN